MWLRLGEANLKNQPLPYHTKSITSPKVFDPPLMSSQYPDLPILQGLVNQAQTQSVGFHTPGHRGGQGTLWKFHQAWQNWQLALDLSELPGLDNLAAPEGIIHQAQVAAAKSFGAEHTWFLINGSTVGVMAAILATTGPNDLILMPRNCHQSVLSGLILAGAKPVLITTAAVPTWGLNLPLSADDLETALNQYPQAKAVLIVAPTYEGVCPDVAAIAQVAHRHELPLIVDEAHGSHFQFHPQFPNPALQAGADIVIQSTHKTLSALTQGAMLHCQGTRVSPQRLSQCLRLLQSSSPSYLLLASLDAARAQMQTHGEVLWDQVLELRRQLEAQLSDLAPLELLNSSHLAPGFSIDPTRLTLGTWPLELSGYGVDAWLCETWGVIAELPTPNALTFLLGLGHGSGDIERLIESWRGLVSGVNTPEFENGRKTWAKLRHLESGHGVLFSGQVRLERSPRDCFFGPTMAINRNQAGGKVSAEWICPYPPGIPLLFPGEVISGAVVDYLIALDQAGATITGASDPSLQTFRVMAN